jgi:hypothetical protein
MASSSFWPDEIETAPREEVDPLQAGTDEIRLHQGDSVPIGSLTDHRYNRQIVFDLFMHQLNRELTNLGRFLSRSAYRLLHDLGSYRLCASDAAVVGKSESCSRQALKLNQWTSQVLEENIAHHPTCLRQLGSARVPTLYRLSFADDLAADDQAIHGSTSHLATVQVAGWNRIAHKGSPDICRGSPERLAWLTLTCEPSCRSSRPRPRCGEPCPSPFPCAPRPACRAKPHRRRGLPC